MVMAYMTIEEAAAIVRQKWPDNDGCRSCGWKSSLADFGNLLDYIELADVERGYVDLPCDRDPESSGHRGARVYLT